LAADKHRSFLQRGRVACNAERCISQAIPSAVRSSVIRWYCTQMNADRIMRSLLLGSINTPVLWYRNGLRERCPLPPKICAQSDPPPSEKRRLRPISAYNVSTVRGSENSSIIVNRKSTTRFPTRHIDKVRTLPHKSPQWVAQKVNLSFLWIKINFNRINSATKFLCVKTSSGKAVAEPIPYLTVYICWR